MTIFECRFVSFSAALICVAALTIAGAPSARAQDGPADPETAAAERQALFAALARAESQSEAFALVNAIWLLWMRAPDPSSQALLDRAMAHRRAGELAGAMEVLDELVARAPGFAEGWNQRATIRFLQGDYDGSLADIDRTLELEPKHFGALSGQAVILIRQGRDRLAQSALRRAVEINPWLHERILLRPVPERRI